MFVFVFFVFFKSSFTGYTILFLGSDSRGKDGAGATRAPVASHNSSKLEQVHFQVLGLVVLP